MSEQAELNLRERTRRAVRSEIVSAAMDVFCRQGFENTTVEEIARAAGISRRSYFRYFPSKDAALAEGLAVIGATVVESLARRPGSEAPWDALRRAFDPLLEHAENEPGARALGSLMLERPALRHDKDTAWHGAIAGALEARMPDHDGDVRFQAEVLASAALACLHTAQARWLSTDGTRLADLLDTAMGTVRDLPTR
ncbi:TetR/AcrR family transcriptional regulator [Streptomyces zingiberis]|uniref:TetR family transcriptional regulator n=1 Tax=Streptomyces zingiberis TaxID=2053010 RepID=A0ABX1BZD7_9ACTN|nr:TetR/AcrR family transcriptional regulator [Streptomyces zingiberis]NJQ00699.1 TetR family transcriptional regulator [Streptomyces zingiberis]